MKVQKFKLILLSFLQFAVWGAYLTSQGRRSGYCVHLHACNHGHHSRQVDSGSEAARSVSCGSRSSHDRCRNIRCDSRCRRGIRSAFRSVYSQYRFLHAHDSYIQFGVLHRTGEIRPGSGEGLSAYQGVGYCRLYMLHVVRGSGKGWRCCHAGDFHAVCGVRGSKHHPGPVYADTA